MPEKIRYSTSKSIVQARRQATSWPSEDVVMYSYQTGTDRIDYGDGKFSKGHWPWKPCVHESIGVTQPVIGETYATGTAYPGSQWQAVRQDTSRAVLTQAYAPSSIPSVPWDESTLGDLLDQVDLNCEDSVMLYANVIQAIPLLGGITRLNHILRDVAQHISKGMRRQPFTTVVKSLISADFIDRFVIMPTIDDARKFADACNYVLRVIETARERSSHVFALQASHQGTLAESVKDESFSTPYDGPSWGAKVHKKTSWESKAFMLLEATYDAAAVDPIKLWATRTGFTRPLESVWDLIPFSFVADYFARGQDFVSALSNEMSAQDGLRGTITRIHDLWGTHLVRSETWTSDEHRTGQPFYLKQTVWNHNTAVVDYPQRAHILNQRFSRFRISDPWRRLAMLESRPEDWCEITLNPSRTQKRTIAELIIQAKL